MAAWRSGNSIVHINKALLTLLSLHHCEGRSHIHNIIYRLSQ